MRLVSDDRAEQQAAKHTGSDTGAVVTAAMTAMAITVTAAAAATSGMNATAALNSRASGPRRGHWRELHLNHL